MNEIFDAVRDLARADVPMWMFAISIIMILLVFRFCSLNSEGIDVQIGKWEAQFYINETNRADYKMLKKRIELLEGLVYEAETVEKLKEVDDKHQKEDL